MMDPISSSPEIAQDWISSSTVHGSEIRKKNHLGWCKNLVIRGIVTTQLVLWFSEPSSVVQPKTTQGILLYITYAPSRRLTKTTFFHFFPLEKSIRETQGTLFLQFGSRLPLRTATLPGDSKRRWWVWRWDPSIKRRGLVVSMVNAIHGDLSDLRGECKHKHFAVEN